MIPYFIRKIVAGVDIVCNAISAIRKYFLIDVHFDVTPFFSNPLYVTIQPTYSTSHPFG